MLLLNKFTVISLAVPAVWVVGNLVLGLLCRMAGPVRVSNLLTSHNDEDDEEDEDVNKEIIVKGNNNNDDDDDDTCSVSVYFVKKSSRFGHCGIFIERRRYPVEGGAVISDHFLYETVSLPNGNVAEVLHQCKSATREQWRRGQGDMIMFCHIDRIGWSSFVKRIKKKRLTHYSLLRNNCRMFSTHVLEDAQEKFAFNASFCEIDEALTLIKWTQRKEWLIKGLFLPAILFLNYIEKVDTKSIQPSKVLPRKKTIFYFEIPVSVSSNRFCDCTK